MIVSIAIDKQEASCKCAVANSKSTALPKLKRSFNFRNSTEDFVSGSTARSFNNIMSTRFAVADDTSDMCTVS